MERRVLIAITLSFLVLFLFQRFVMPPSAPPETQSVATGGKPSDTAAPAPGSMAALTQSSNQSAVTAAPPASPALPALPAPPAPPALTIGETADREIVVETTTVRATFTNRGGRLLHWVLKEYRNEDGTPLDLVPQNIGPDAVKPFSLAVDDPAVTERINSSLYRVVPGGDNPSLSAEADSAKVEGLSDRVDATSTAQTLTFEMSASDGLSVTKTFVLEPSGYLVTFSTVVQLGQARLNPVIHWGAGLGDEIANRPPSSFFSPSTVVPAQPMIYTDGDVERVPPTAAGAQEGPFRYAGASDHYFASLLLNETTPVPFRIDYAPVNVPVANDPTRFATYLTYSVRYQTPQAASRFFFGPKAFNDLRAVDTELVRSIHFGIFSWLAVPLLNALQWVHSYVGNWGWSIVVLTILINLAMFPLRHKSVVSMKKMQELQPQMKAIQERYAKYKITDPERQKMNTEVMELYKTKGVNPASGCVPMLLTMPFLFAFYSMLSVAIEIRGAHFFGWIHNLSAPDPLFITPVLMGVAQFWQTKMTPTTADPTQQKIMMFMPIMFTFMSLSFPSGLVIYWLVSTVWTVGQQYATNYLIGAPAKRIAK
ncbi:MAG: membrane protein insertase YidC [Acidobacteriota bacterium]|nr:membrane protein insertase YidC [Acidobacteriota bacterium]